MLGSNSSRWGGIFEICICDDYGTISTRLRLANDGKPLDLDPRQNLCLLWSTDSLDEYWEYDAHTDVQLHSSMQRREESSGDALRGLSLKDCLRLFTTEETLGANDMWYCGGCKEHRQAHKKMDVWKLPPIVVIHLKRFSYKSRYNREKIDLLVDFPLEGLDFSDFLPDTQDPLSPPVYDLFAISNHYGSMGGGHYTAYAKHRTDGKWYNYDDRSVSPVSDPTTVKTSAAYVLFYRRRDVGSFSQPFSQGSANVGADASDNEDDAAQGTLDVQL
jgi:hypothetical protein